MMYAITKVYISGTGLPIHYLRADRSPAAIRMGSAIADTIIGFRLYNSAGTELTIKISYYYFADQFPGNLHHIRSPIERIIHFFYGRHQINILSLKTRTFILYNKTK